VSTHSLRAPALPAEERRACIVDATVPLLRAKGGSVTTREIAAAAGVAEGTIFRVFPDKDALVAAAVETACDPAPTEQALSAIDRTLPFEAQLIKAVTVLQRRFVEVWALLSAVGAVGSPTKAPPDYAALVELFEQFADELRTDPVTAARRLRAITLALTHPSIYPGEPVAADEIVTLLLDGLRAGRRSA
jgi:AcrR family transcriptional regulator